METGICRVSQNRTPRATAKFKDDYPGRKRRECKVFGMKGALYKKTSWPYGR